MAEERTQDAQQKDREAAEQRGLARRESAFRPPALPVASPFTFLSRFMDDLDHLFGSGPFMLGTALAPSGREGRQATWLPPLEIVEREGQLVIRADVPGLSKDQIDVEVEDGQLVISGERSQEREERRGGVYQSERFYGTFYRVVPLPEGVDPEKASATFAKGVLEIVLPMSKRTRAQRVEIKEGTETKPAEQAERKSA